MRCGLVQALHELGKFEEEAAVIASRSNEMTLGLIYLLRERGARVFPVSTAELLEESVQTAEVEARLQTSVAAALEGR